MVSRCCIVGCKSATHNRKGEKLENGLTFHRFPAWRRDHGEQVSQITKSRRLAWVAAVKRRNITFHSIPTSMRVCSLHFHSGKPAYEMYECHPDWAPTLHLGHTDVKAVNPERYKRRTRRKQGLKQNTAAPATSPDLPDIIVEIDDVPLVKEEPLDEDAPPDEVSQRLQMDEAAPKDELVEQKECRFCDHSPEADPPGPDEDIEQPVMVPTVLDHDYYGAWAPRSKLLFISESKPAYEMYECHPDWAPTLHLGHTDVKAVNPERYNRRTKRKQGLKQNTAAPATSPDLPDLILEIDDIPLVKEEPPDEDEVSQRLQMDEAAPKDELVEQKECSFCDCRRAEMNHLLEENRLLKEELSKKTISEDYLGDDEKVEYYTGLPCLAVLMGVLTKLLPCLKQTRCKLSPFQMLFLTLMRLRLNLPIQHVAHLFCIDQKTVSTTFRDTIGALFTHLSPLVHWPERHCLKGGILQQFVEVFGNHVAVIVDCFEMNTERASKENSIAQTSSQKHTLKYLIGFTPRGATAFVSKGWEGGFSDKDVIESSGLLDKLLPGDLVLVDRGSDTGDVVGLMCAEVENQKLVPKDEVETRKIAHLRVHLKRVIGCVRTKYTMLSEAVPVSMIAPCEDDGMIFLDKVVTVCCALTNMCPSVMKLENMT
ncbi:uncharacterized protein LOC128015405 [Carassius gibelio]|uniref:uncharacterized protein LOC128015405 n=1 Tax=Carassius gibelio TaxID=101364 RepID=UPI002278B35F|nr:uncharacterized protein LOC128015405 [Carassius gibelio]